MSEDYSTSKDTFGSTWWICEIYYHMKSVELDKGIFKVLNESSGLVDKTKKWHLISSVFHRENTSFFPEECGNYFDYATKDDQQLEQLRESFLEEVAQVFYECYGAKGISEEETYKDNTSTECCVKI